MRNATNPLGIALLAIMLGACTPALALQVSVNGANPTCGNSTGYAYVFAWGGVPPYTYSWSNGAQTDTITGLAPGTYTVTATDANSDQANGMITLGDLPNPVLEYIAPAAGLHGCHGQCNNGFWYYEELMPMNLVPPFTFSNPPTYGVDPFNLLQGAWTGFCDGFSGSFTSVTDALGCVAQLTVYPGMIDGSDPGPMSVVSVEPSCEGMSGGTAVVNVGVEDGNAYTPLWQCRFLNAAMQPLGGVAITAVPITGQNITSAGLRPPGDYFLERTFQNITGDCLDLIPFTIPSLGTDCGIVNGTAYVDVDENCFMAGAEARVPSGLLEVQPGPYYTTLAGNGTYALSLPSGSYTLSQTSPAVVEHCTGSPIPFAINAGATTLRNLPDTSVVALDLESVISSGAARPGFQFQCGVTVRNLTPTSSGNATLALTFDPLLTFLNASPPGIVAGNTITWNQSQLTAWQQRSYTINFQVPPNPALLGTELVTTAFVSSANTDGDLTNNAATNYRTITGSYDPNDKLAQTSSRWSNELYYIDQDEWIDYTIRFQNTGTDTAFNILITDTLPSVLDPASIQMGAGSHPFSWQLRDQGTLKFYFQNILLPDSNLNEPLSHGFVSFRIRPHLPMAAATVIENIANIYFDFNPPVITEPCVLVAEFSTGVSDALPVEALLSPNPAIDRVRVSDPSVAAKVRQWEVISFSGATLEQGNGPIPASGIPIGHLENGAYVWRMHTLNETRNERFIKIDQ